MTASNGDKQANKRPSAPVPFPSWQLALYLTIQARVDVYICMYTKAAHVFPTQCLQKRISHLLGEGEARRSKSPRVFF